MSSHATNPPLRFLLATALWLCAPLAIAHAQEPAEITLRLNASDLDVIGKALDALPFSKAMSAIIRIQAQIDAQPGPQWDKYRSATTVQEWTRTGWKRVPQ
jgi:hypothetical protein